MTINNESKNNEVEQRTKSDLNNLYISRMPDEFYEDAESDVGESSELREKCIKELLSWFDENPSINGHRDIHHIIYFLRTCKYNMDKVKMKITR